jgi:hypothetical protein
LSCIAICFHDFLIFDISLLIFFTIFVAFFLFYFCHGTLDILTYPLLGFYHFLVFWLYIVTLNFYIPWMFFLNICIYTDF